MIAEQRFVLRCMERGVECYAPTCGTNEAVDFVIYHGDGLATVQVKKATVAEHASWGSPRVMACLHGCASRAYKDADPDYRKRIDYFAFVCPELSSIWLVPESEITVKQTWGVKLSDVTTLDRYLF